MMSLHTRRILSLLQCSVPVARKIETILRRQGKLEERKNVPHPEFHIHARRAKQKLDAA